LYFLNVFSVLSPAASTDGEGAIVRISSGTAKQKEFVFDHVLGQDDGQDAVWDSVQPLLTSVTHGYNICVFAYGQTGSGPTPRWFWGHLRNARYRATDAVCFDAVEGGGGTAG